MIKLLDVDKIYSKNNQVAIGLEKVNLRFNIGDFVLIEGESGSGKSTLLNIISGKIYPTNGQMLFNGIDTNAFGIEEWKNYKRNVISYISQEYDLIYDMTVKNNILVGCINEVSDSRIKYILDLVGIKKYINKPVKYLSKGEVARVSIARALIMDNPIILVDEATANLDSENSDIIFKALKSISDEKLIIVVSHKNEFNNEIFNRHIIVSENRIVEDKGNVNDRSVSIYNSVETDKKGLRLLKFIFLIRLKNRVLNIFIYTILVFLAAILSFTIGSLNENEKYEKTDVFSNMNEDRVILIKEDNKPFNDRDYNNLKNYNYDKLIKNDIILDLEIEAEMLIRSIGEKSYSYNIEDASNLELSSGTMPTDENQIVLSCDSGFIDLKNDYVKISVPNCRNIFVLKVVGFTKSKNNIIYMNEKMMDYIYKDYVIANSSKKVSSNDTYLEDFVLCFNELVDEGSAVTNVEATDKLSISINSDKYNGTINDLTIYEDLEVLNSISFLEDEKYVIINPKDYNSLVSDERYQISLFLDNVNEVTLNKLEKDYLVYYPHILNENSTNSTSVLLELVYGTIVVGSLLVVMFIFIKANNKSIEKGFKENWIYYRLGYKKNEIIICSVIDTLFNFVVATIIAVILCLLIKKNYLGEFILEYYSVINHILLSILLVGIFLLGHVKKYNKEFKKGEEL